jgi:hypothetical protein
MWLSPFTSNWPRNLWLGVDQRGVHLLGGQDQAQLVFDMLLTGSPSPATGLATSGWTSISVVFVY